MIYIYDTSLNRAFDRAREIADHYVDTANKRTTKKGFMLGLKKNDSSNTDNTSNQNVKKGVL